MISRNRQRLHKSPGGAAGTTGSRLSIQITEKEVKKAHVSDIEV